MSKVVCTDIVDAYRSGRKQVVVIWGSPSTADEGYRILVDGQVPMFRSFRSCAVGLRRYLDYGRRRASHEPRTVGAPYVPEALLGLLELSGPLAEHESAQIAEAFGVPVVRSRLTIKADEAVAAAEELGYPVVAKATGPEIQHKSEMGLVHVGVAGEAELRAVFDELANAPGSEGVLLQEMVSEGEEVIVGFSDDPQFGPVVLFGLGGIFIAVLQDVALRVGPRPR